jgi:hypothetical protein
LSPKAGGSWVKNSSPALRRIVVLSKRQNQPPTNAEGREGRSELTSLAEEQADLRRVATLVARGEAPAVIFAAASQGGRCLDQGLPHSAVCPREESDWVSIGGQGAESRPSPAFGG